MSRPLRAERFPGIEETDAVIEHGLPEGLCIWRFPRQTVTNRTGEKARKRLYTVTHAGSGVAIVPGAFPTLARARHAAFALADVRYRGKPVDLTLTVEALRAIDRVRLSALALGGYFVISNDYDAETVKWAARNDVDLEAWKPNKKVAA